ncbi:hypothetical protein Tco_0321423 [Tanacetum coccineum]
MRSKQPRAINDQRTYHVIRFYQVVSEPGGSRYLGSQGFVNDELQQVVDRFDFILEFSWAYRENKSRLTDIVKLVVEIESFGMSSDEFDKKTRLFDGLQPKQADLSCIYVLNELRLHEIRVVPSKHEADQY